MSLFDRICTEDADAQLTGKPLVESEEPKQQTDAEILGLTEDVAGALGESLGGHIPRYMNYRDLQYALEDAVTTCERNWTDKKRWREPGVSKLDKSHADLVQCIKDCAKRAKSFADAFDAAQKERV